MASLPPRIAEVGGGILAAADCGKWEWNSPNMVLKKHFQFSLLIAAICGSASAPAQAEPAISFTQNSSTTGTHTCTVSEHYFRIDLPRINFVITSEAPKWNVTVRNVRANLYCEVPAKSFNANYMNNAMQMQMAELGLLEEVSKSATKTKYQALPAVAYPVKLEDDEYKFFVGSKASQYTVWDNTKAPPGLGRVIKRLCGFNNIKTDLVPLELAIIGRNRKLTKYLSTSKIVLASKLDSTPVPSNYKKVRNEHEVFNDKNMQSDIQDLIDNTPMPR